MKPLSAMARSLPVSGIRQLMDLAATLQDVIHLEVGEPAENTPDEIIAAAADAARAGFTRYSPNAGYKDLRVAIAAKLARENGIKVDFSRVVVTPGAVASLTSAMLAILDPGDEVLLPDPGWPNYVGASVLAGAVAVPYPLDRASGFLPDLERLESLVTPRTKMILVNSPSNPCGSVFPRATIEALVRFAQRHDLYLLSDEVYEAYVYEGEHVSPATFDEDGRVVSVFGFSKTYAMTGWRLGYVVAAPAVAQLIANLQGPLTSCSNSLAQKGALAGLERSAGFVSSQRDAYRTRRDLVVDLFRGTDVLVAEPKGAFYAMLDMGGPQRNSDELARALLNEEKVATAPGSTFGSNGSGMLRISFAAAPKDIEEGCRRILRFRQRLS